MGIYAISIPSQASMSGEPMRASVRRRPSASSQAGEMRYRSAAHPPTHRISPQQATATAHKANRSAAAPPPLPRCAQRPRRAAPNADASTTSVTSRSPSHKGRTAGLCGDATRGEQPREMNSPQKAGRRRKRASAPNLRPRQRAGHGRPLRATIPAPRHPTTTSPQDASGPPPLAASHAQLSISRNSS